MKPVLLLDVDGVLNVSGPDMSKPGRFVRLKPDGRPFHPTPYVKPFLRWAWRHLEVVWCTTWRDTANQIADWAGLPRARVVQKPKRFKQDGEHDWKAEGAQALLGRAPRFVFWIEDGILSGGHAWVSKRPHTYYLAADSFEGVTPSHAKLITQLANLEWDVPK